jgi:hypothetical protein
MNKGFLNTNMVITQHLMHTVRMQEAEWRQLLRESVGMGAKENGSSNGHVQAAGFHHVRARSCLACVLKPMNRLLLNFQIFFQAAVNRR